MKRFLMSFVLTFAFFGILCAQENGGRKWLKRYKIDPMNDNPVFTRPPQENDNARMEGAGICMDDGQAYNRHYFGFGSDWRYEPKLDLCTQEEEVINKLFGVYVPKKKEGMGIGQLLKHGVIPTDFGAIVAYRLWDDDQVRHFFATYDHKGNLIDAFYAGYSEWMQDILKTEPHGEYKSLVNMGGNSLKFSQDNTTLTKECYFYYRDKNDRSLKYEDTTIYNISSKGIFSIKSQKVSGMPDVNKEILELTALEMLPLSDMEAIPKWNAFLKKGIKTEALKERIEDDIVRLFISRQQEYMAWTYANQKESVLIGALKPGFERLFRYRGGGFVQMLLAEGIEECKDSKVANYWLNLKTFRSLFDQYM